MSSHSQIDSYSELMNLSQSTQHILSQSSYVSREQVNILSASIEKIVLDVNLDENKNELSAKHLGKKKPGDDDKQRNTDIDDGDNDIKNNVDKTNAKSTTHDDGSHGQSDKCPPTASDAQDGLVKSRFKVTRLRRCISESEARVKGILKYPNNWKRRTMSESICDMDGNDDANDFDHDYHDDEDGSDNDMENLDNSEHENKPEKKSVRFNEKVFKSVFRANSSILGRRQKNQKRSAKKKAKKIRDGFKSENNKDDNMNDDKNMKDKEDTKIESDTNPVERSRARQDSGYDSSKENDANEEFILILHDLQGIIDTNSHYDAIQC